MIELDLNKVVKRLKKKYEHTGVVSEDKGLTDFVSTGNLTFDLISDGGVPFGVMTEFIGLSQSGKSLFCQQILANAQRDYNAIGVVIDRENAFTDKRARELNVDTDRVIKARPKDTPLVSDAFDFLIETIAGIREQSEEAYIVGIIDSIQAFDKDVDLIKSDQGRKAKAVKDGLRKLFTSLDERTMLLVVNHFYFNVGQMFGDPKVAAGGEGLKYFNTVRFALQDRTKIIDMSKGGEVVGQWIGVEVIKTRLGPSHRKCYIPFFYKEGIPWYGGYVRMLVDRGYVEPKNKSEFGSFKQTTVKKDDKQYNEFDVDRLLKDHPELEFKEYPEYATK